jgi:DUF2075 family protein
MILKVKLIDLDLEYRTKIDHTHVQERVRQNTDHVGGEKILDFEFDYLIQKPIKSYYENQNISSF